MKNYKKLPKEKFKQGKTKPTRGQIARPSLLFPILLAAMLLPLDLINRYFTFASISNTNHSFDQMRGEQIFLGSKKFEKKLPVIFSLIFV